MSTIPSWIKCFAIVCSTISLVSGHGRLIDPPQRSSLWREGWEVPKNYEDHSLNCGGFWHQWGEMDGKCGVCGDPYDSDRPHEAGGRYANGIIARTYDSAAEFIEVTVEVTASVGGYFEFKLCPHNNIDKPVKQSCLDQYPLRIEHSGRRLYIDLPLGKSGFVIARLNIPQGVTCQQCVLQWKWHGGNHWGMCNNGIGLAGCGPQTEFYNCADISILPGASSDDNKHDVKPRPNISRQDSSFSLTNRKSPPVVTFIKKSTTVSSANSTRLNFRSKATTMVPFTSTQTTTSVITRRTPEHTSRMYFTPNIRTTLEYTSSDLLTTNIVTNSVAIDYKTTPQSIPTTRLLLTLDSIKYHTSAIPSEAKSTTIKLFSSDSLSSNIVTSTQNPGKTINNGARFMSVLPVSGRNFMSTTKQTSISDPEISTTKLSSISTSTWTQTPMTSTIDQSIRTSTNTTTPIVVSTTQSTTATKTDAMSSTATSETTTTSSTGTSETTKVSSTGTSETATMSSTGTLEIATMSLRGISEIVTSSSTFISTSVPATTSTYQSTTAPYTVTIMTETTTQPQIINTTRKARSTSTIATQSSAGPTTKSLSIYTSTQTPKTEQESTTKSLSISTSTQTPRTEQESTTKSLSIYTSTQTPITEQESTTQKISGTSASSAPSDIHGRTIFLITALTGSPKPSQTITSSNLNPNELINAFTKPPKTIKTEVPTTTAEIPPTTTIFQTTRVKEAALKTTMKPATKIIDKPIVRGSPPARREGGLSVATLFPFDLTRNLIDPSNSGINTEIKPVRRPRSNSLFNS